MMYPNNKYWSCKAFTLVEMLVAIAIIAIIFAVIVPQLRVTENSWENKAGAAETLQNGRILIDHLNRNLSKAVRITAVSGPAETNGYIEFIDNDANNIRYDVNSISNYVEFGLIGNLSELAGPVSQLLFTCYDSNDFITPITDVNSIRFIKVQTTLTNPARLDQDMNFSTQAYLHTNALPSIPMTTKMSEPWLEFDTAQGMEPALVQMSGRNYLCAYRGSKDDGWACVVTVNPSDWSVSADSFIEYDTKQGVTPALAIIDETNFLCAYQGDKGDGWACMLYEWPSNSGTIEAGPKLEFDTADCIDPSMCNIISQGDDHYLLCAYGKSYEVCAIVLKATATSTMKQLDAPGVGITFPAAFSPMPALAKIDDTHYLCAYQGQNGGVHGGAVVLTINNPVSGAISIGSHFNFFGESAGRIELAQIDSTHYLCTYETSNNGRATVLTVDPNNWTISKDPGYFASIDLMSTSTHALCKVDSTNFLCAYPALSTGGCAAVNLTINTTDFSITTGASSTIEPTSGLTTALCQIDSEHYLCAYRGLDSDGFVGVLKLNTGILP